MVIGHRGLIITPFLCPTSTPLQRGTVIISPQTHLCRIELPTIMTWNSESSQQSNRTLRILEAAVQGQYGVLAAIWQVFVFLSIASLL